MTAPYVPAPPHADPRMSGAAAASLLLGIPGMFAACCFALGIFTLLAIALGHVGLNETRGGARAGRGFAQGGLLMGYAGLATGIIVIVGTALHLGS